MLNCTIAITMTIDATASVRMRVSVAVSTLALLPSKLVERLAHLGRDLHVALLASHLARRPFDRPVVAARLEARGIGTVRPLLHLARAVERREGLHGDLDDVRVGD